MSFTQDVKMEICNNELLVCCKKAELAAIIQMCGFLNICQQQFNLEIRTQNPTIAKRALTLLKQLFTVETELLKLRQFKFAKKHSYIIRVKTAVKPVLEDLTLWGEQGLNNYPKATIVKKDCCRRAYLAGAFLASGSINSPRSTSYHLEVSCNEESLANYLLKLLKRYEIAARIIRRRSKYVLYLKQSEKIGDFLRLVGAAEALMKFEDSRIQRDYVNSIHRLDNCDIANEVRIQRSAGKQISDINKVLAKYGAADLDERLKEVAFLRLENPDLSFLELSDLYQEQYHQPLSKSGIRHRLNKISDLAEKIEQ